MKTVTEILWLINVSFAAAGMCIGAAQIIRSGFLYLTSRGQCERIAEAKSIPWHAVMGTAIIVGTFIFVLVMHSN